jgi:hypothetical protein
VSQGIPAPIAYLSGPEQPPITTPTLPQDPSIPQPDEIAQGTGDLPTEPAFYDWYSGSPGEALQYLIHLPPTLAALDFLTKVLGTGDERFAVYSLTAGDVAREHLQYALRHIESLGAAAAEEDTDDEQRNSGPNEQGQAVKVLVVYLRNLIARGILPLETVFLDVQEICVRYIFLPEVREFRAWLESAVGGGSSPVGMLSPGPAGLVGG